MKSVVDGWSIVGCYGVSWGEQFTGETKNIGNHRASDKAEHHTTLAALAIKLWEPQVLPVVLFVSAV
jgi:hypothetical protein